MLRGAGTTVLLRSSLALSRPLVHGLRTRQPWSRRCSSSSTIRCRPTASRQVGTRTRRFASGSVSFLLTSVVPREGVRLMLAAEGPRWARRQPVRRRPPASAGDLLAAIDELGQARRRGAANFLNCFRLASSLDSDNEVGRRVVVFTDGQAKGGPPTLAACGNACGQPSLDSAGCPLRGYRGRRPASRRCEPVHRSRRFIASSDGRRRINRHHRADHEHRHAEAPSSRVVWKIDGKRQGESELPQLGVGQTTLVAWRTSFDHPGVRDISASDPS